MSGPDTLSQAFGTLLLALAFSAFIVFVRGYRPGGVSGAWYDLVLAFVAVWLAFWPEAAYSHARRAWPMPWGWSCRSALPCSAACSVTGWQGDCGGRCGKPGKKDRLLRQRAGEVPRGNIEKIHITIWAKSSLECP